MNEKILEVLKLCEKTGGWYGIKITSLDQRNNLDDTPLHTVCSWGEINPVKILVEAGANINALGDKASTPIFSAVNSESIEVVKYLVQKGADLKIKNEWDRSIINYAKNTSTPIQIIKFLESELSRKSNSKY